MENIAGFQTRVEALHRRTRAQVDVLLPLVAVGIQGIPDDVMVVPLSRLAREQDKNESEVIAVLEARGYRLASPEAFIKTLERLKRKVLKGTLSLPVPLSSLGRHGESIYRTR